MRVVARHSGTNQVDFVYRITDRSQIESIFIKIWNSQPTDFRAVSKKINIIENFSCQNKLTNLDEPFTRSRKCARPIYRYYPPKFFVKIEKFEF